jgi:hypothetical protein
MRVSNAHFFDDQPEGAGCGCVFVQKLQGKVTTAQVDPRTVYQKKSPSLGIPCTAVRVFGLKKLFLSIVFTKIKKSCIRNIQPVPAPHVSRTNKFTIPPVILFASRGCRFYRPSAQVLNLGIIHGLPWELQYYRAGLESNWQSYGPSKLLFGVLLRGAAFFCTSYRGKLLQHKLIRLQCTNKSTRVPVSPVPQYGYSV